MLRANLQVYRAKVEKELNDICEEILAILDNHLIVNHASDESKVGPGRCRPYPPPHPTRVEPSFLELYGIL